jgi:cytochrome c-type biogenesis protein CcmH
VAEAAARPRLRWPTIAALALGLPAAALALYSLFGDPGAIGRDRTATAELATAADAPDALPDAQHYADLERHLSRWPDDARALVLKARLDVQAQRYELAATGYQKALETSPKVARDAGVWVEYAEARGLLQGGTLEGQPRQLVDKALSLDAANPQALDLAGSAAWERREFAAAAAYWRRLLDQLTPGSTRHAELSAAIASAEQRARVALPPAR